METTVKANLLESQLAIEPDKHMLDRVKEQDLAAALITILLWRKVRSSRLDGLTRASIIDHILQAIEKCEPVRIVNSFGGFKAYRVRSAPYPDWSEVFHLAFFCRWLINVAMLHEPGVQLEYSGQSEIATLVDNYKATATKCYIQGFIKLVALFNDRVPSNFEISVRDLSEFYNPAELHEAVLGSDPSHGDEPEVDETSLWHARRNFVFDGELDLTGFTLAEQEEVLRRSVRRLWRWYAYDRVHRARYFSNAITVSNGLGLSDFYHVRSVAGSNKNFWMTEGVLLKTDGGFHPDILMPDDKRLEQFMDQSIKSIFAPISPDLSRIRMIAIPPPRHAQEEFK